MDTATQFMAILIILDGDISLAERESGDLAMTIIKTGLWRDHRQAPHHVRRHVASRVRSLPIASAVAAVNLSEQVAKLAT